MPRYLEVHLALSLALCACQGPGGTSPEPPKTASVAAPASGPVEDTRTQFDFARDWAQVDAIEEEEEQAKQALALGRQWQGRRYRWYGYTVPGLCVEAERRCNV